MQFQIAERIKWQGAFQIVESSLWVGYYLDHKIHHIDNYPKLDLKEYHWSIVLTSFPPGYSPEVKIHCISCGKLKFRELVLFHRVLLKRFSTSIFLSYYILLALVFLGVHNNLTGQSQVEQKDTLIKHQLRLHHDNDFFTLTDRYYSSGLSLTYTHLLKHGLLNGGNEQLTFSIGQEVHTPSDIQTTEITEQDRPYVGFLSLKAGWSYVKKNHGVDASILAGLAGNASGAGGFQRWYHNIFVISDPPVWVGEMENSLHANIYTSYRREWQLAPNPFSITLVAQPALAFGTKDIYAHTDLIAYFGRKNPLASSMAYHRIGSTQREIFFSLRAGYRYVGHNALLEGNFLGDTSSVLLVPANKEIIYAGFDVQHRFGKNQYWFGYRIQSAEAMTTESHKYVILSYARNF